jgi:hypothetical protein
VSVETTLQTLRGFLLFPIPGLLNLEKLLRQFLISKDTLSVRMLDDTRDPTPLLKEIRDDKTATIIIHANASMSHTILLKVGAWLGWVRGGWFTLLTSAFLTRAVVIPWSWDGSNSVSVDNNSSKEKAG